MSSNNITLRVERFVISQPVERLRAGPILLQLTVDWVAETGQQGEAQRYTVPGLSQLPDGDLTPAAMHKAMDEALDYSRQLMRNLLNQQATVLTGEQANAVLRTLLTRRREEVKTVLSRTLSDEDLDRASTDAHQRQMNDLCDRLGIQRIDLQGTTVLEASTMINELQFVTKSIIKVGD